MSDTERVNDVDRAGNARQEGSAEPKLVGGSRSDNRGNDRRDDRRDDRRGDRRKRADPAGLLERGDDSKSKLKSAYTNRAARPAWMEKEEYQEVERNEKRSFDESITPSSDPTQESAQSGGDGKKLKRPARRSNFVDQQKRAEDARVRDEQREQAEDRYREKVAQNNDKLVKSFYNQRVNIARKQIRILSPIIKLRNFNNAIKYMLINKFAKEGDKVLDIGVGKGGDLSKWSMAGISQFIGVDLSDASIIEAVSRYRRMRDLQFAAIFATGDCYTTPIPKLLEQFRDEVRFPMDMVSMQFCMHYAFETEAKARMMLSNVSKSLKRGGIFIGTIPSSDYMRERIKTLPEGEKKFGNSLYSVTFTNDPPRDGEFRPAFGQEYSYFLVDAVDNVPEYVVPFEAFRALAEEYDLELKYKKEFSEIFKEEIPTWYNKLSRKITDGMRRRDGTIGIEGEEAEAASSFYLAFAFEKGGYN